MSTLREIAEETGLAIGTVSRILRGKQRVAQDTEKHVFEVADRLKYRPNMLIRGIQTGRSQSIGVDMRIRVDGFRAPILSGITDELMKVDYVPIVVSGGPDGHPGQADRIHSLVDRRVDGMILFPDIDTEPDEYLKKVWDRGIPLVTVDRMLVHAHADFVGTDDVEGGRLAAQHLLGLGHRRLAHLAAPQNVMTAQNRKKGFDAAVSRVVGATVKTLDEETWLADPVTTRELLMAADRPTAIFCDNDQMAVGLYAVAREMDLRVPDDLSVVGYADLPLNQGMQPSLTTLRQNPYEIGVLAARQVLSRIEGKCTDEEPVRVCLKPELLVRESTAEPPNHY